MAERVKPGRIIAGLAVIGGIFALILGLTRKPEAIILPEEFPPANIVLSNLIIEPDKVYMGQSVSIVVVATNIGGLEGSYEVTCEVNGNIMTKIVTLTRYLSPGDTKTVSFTFTPIIGGTYQVSINGLGGTITVLEPIKKEEIIYTCPIDGVQFDTLAEMDTYMAEKYPPVYPAEEQPIKPTTPGEEAFSSWIMEMIPEAHSVFWWTGQF